MQKILFVSMVDYKAWAFGQALEVWESQHHGVIEGRVYASALLNRDEVLAAECAAFAAECDFLMIGAHGSVQCIGCFREVWEACMDRVPVFFSSSMPEEMAEVVPHAKMDPETFRTMSEYFSVGDPDSMCNLIAFAANALFGGHWPVEPPKQQRESGIYTPEGVVPEGMEREFAHSMEGCERPVIGLLVHKFCVLTQNAKYIDALMAEIEARGAQPYAIYASFTSTEDNPDGVCRAMERYFRRSDGGVIPESIVVTYGFSLSMLSGGKNSAEQVEESIFQKWDVPVIQAMAIYVDKQFYRANIRGLDTVSLPICVYQPEFDGQIISVPVATEETLDGCEPRKQMLPLKERVGRVAEMACRWARLRRVAQSEKKVAIVLHNMPPRNDTLGTAHGLDSMQSVADLLKRLERMGICVERRFENGQELAEAMLKAVTNDHRYTADEELLKNSVDSVDRAHYQKWFDALSPKVREELLNVWGAPVGKVLSVEDRIVLPGILTGNVFLGLQPGRGDEERAEQMYHSTDNPPPHSYIAFYRWLDEVFGADVVVHVGTHGTLEWLPGKEVGLSESCYSDINIGSMPHLYLYVINILGEGIQAKRRSYAVILDHMIPSLDEADAYDELKTIDEALEQYHHAKLARPEQAREIALRVVELADSMKLTEDLDVAKDALLDDLPEAMDKIHRWVSKLSSSMISDGLHIFGRVPEGKRFDNLARALVRVPNGETPALNDGILTAQCYDPEAMRKDPMRLFEDGETALRKQNLATMTARRIVAGIAEADYDAAAIRQAVDAEAFSGDTRMLETTLRYMCQTVAPLLRRIDEEMMNLENGLNGRFVPPGRGGCPTRGSVDILPTGRNFYAVDPATIPSRAAYSIGTKLAEQAIEANQRENGCVPESAAIVVYSDACMRTCGEDLGEALAFMGVRPVYLGQTNRVIGLEAIPLHQLGRPRVDVVLRISGLFRDTFPNLIELMEKAVTIVSALDEPPEMNFIRKHVDEELAQMLGEGIDLAEAQGRATLRVFGCPPGNYGAGVSKAIHNRNWETLEDLANVYALWGGNAYSSRYHGQKMPETFRKRLSTVSVAIKNESSVEGDLLGSDDFFAYHGGLIACVHAASGKRPIGLIGQTADPERPESNTVEQELARVMRSKVLNPKWIEGMKRHGYKGAQEISTQIDRVFGWDASTGAARQWMYDGYAQKFLMDDEMREWIAKNNPAAVFYMSQRLLEAHQRGMWTPDEKTLSAVQQIYMNAEGSMEDDMDS